MVQIICLHILFAKILHCIQSQLRDKLNHPANRRFLSNLMEGRMLQTTYNDRNGEKKQIKFGGLTTRGADSVLAFGRLPRPFNVNIAAYFYCRHRIRLAYPYLPIVIESFLGKGEDRYYPLELLEIQLEDNESEQLIDSNSPIGPPEQNLFELLPMIGSGIKEQKDEEEEDKLTIDEYDSARCECSQKEKKWYKLFP